MNSLHAVIASFKPLAFLSSTCPIFSLKFLDGCWRHAGQKLLDMTCPSPTQQTTALSHCRHSVRGSPDMWPPAYWLYHQHAHMTQPFQLCMFLSCEVQPHGHQTDPSRSQDRDSLGAPQEHVCSNSCTKQPIPSLHTRGLFRRSSRSCSGCRALLGQVQAWVQVSLREQLREKDCQPEPCGLWGFCCRRHTALTCSSVVTSFSEYPLTLNGSRDLEKFWKSYISQFFPSLSIYQMLGNWSDKTEKLQIKSTTPKNQISMVCKSNLSSYIVLLILISAEIYIWTTHRELRAFI